MVYIIIVFIVLFIYWFYWVLRSINPWKFYLYIGKKGSGKSCLAVDIAKRKRKALIYDKFESFPKRFKLVPLKLYSNFDIQGVDYEYFNPLELGITFFPNPYSILLCDEISTYWLSRNFKTMSQDTLNWFINQRKHRCMFYGFTQSFNIDKQLRNLTDRMALVKSFLITFSCVRTISKMPDIKESAMDCDSQLVDVIKFDSILMPGAIRFLWLPKYYKMFDTNERFDKSKHSAEKDSVGSELPSEGLLKLPAQNIE